MQIAKLSNLKFVRPLVMRGGANGATVSLATAIPNDVRPIIIIGAPTNTYGSTNVGGGYLFGGSRTNTTYGMQQIWSGTDGTESYLNDPSGNWNVTNSTNGNLWNNGTSALGGAAAASCAAFEINGNPTVATNGTAATLGIEVYDQTTGKNVYLFQAPAPILIEAWLTSPPSDTRELPATYQAIQIFQATNGSSSWITNSSSLVINSCYNTNEDNWPAGVGGTAQLANLPPGFSYSSVPTGTGTNGVHVQLTGHANTNIAGGFVWYFYKENPIIGFCA